MQAHEGPQQPTTANEGQHSVFCFIFYSLFLLLRDSAHPTPRLQIRAGGGFTHHHQPPTITTTTTSPPAAPPGPPSPGLETRLGPFFRHSIHHHHHWGPRRVSGLQFLFISFILFYISQ